MSASSKNLHIGIYVWFIILSILSLMFSFRSYNGAISWTQNDTYNYYQYSLCLKEYTIEACNSPIGMISTEVILSYFAILSNYLFDNHYFLFFSASFLFTGSLICFYMTLGWHMIFVLPLVILSPQFWELNLNIIRNAYALSFFIFSLVFFLNKYQITRVGPVFFLLSILSHSVGILYSIIVVLAGKVNLVYLAFILFLILISSEINAISLIDLISSISFLNQNIIMSKLFSYSQYHTEDSADGLISIIGKVYLTISFILVFVSKSLRDDRFEFICKVLFLILIFGCLLKDSSIVYRIINVYVFLIFYLVVYGIKRKPLISCSLYALCVSWGLFDFITNHGYYLRYLNI